MFFISNIGEKMFSNKYHDLALLLRQRIAADEYREVLPPVRTLCREFGVSMQTMHKAIRNLAESGLVRPTPRGTFLRRITPEYGQRLNAGIVGIVSQPECRLEQDFFIVALTRTLKEYGLESILIQAEKRVLVNTEFWRNPKLCGYIFVYRSFYSVLAHQLRMANTPYVAANYLPETLPGHWVDFDSESLWREMVQTLLNMNFTRIALAVNFQNDKAPEHCHGIWQRLTRSFGIHNYLPSVDDFSNSEATFTKWLNSKPPPEVVIPVHGYPHQLKKKFEELGHPMKIAALKQDVYEQNYAMLAQTTVEVFTAVVNNLPNCSCRNLVSWRHAEFELI